MLFALVLATFALLPLTFGKVLHTSSRWILDENNARFKLRCVNWAGHLEANIPEGLQHQSVTFIASKIASLSFNCVRLTYSIDMALSQNTLVSTSIASAATTSGADAGKMNALYQLAVVKNPFLGSATIGQTFGTVIEALEAEGVLVILDNHVSKASWCCNFTDGNGWFADASNYIAANSRWFNTTNWLSGLGVMANFAKKYPNVVGMSLRNEMRPVPLIQDLNGGADWYSHVTAGANAIHSANSDLLIMIGGIAGATDFSFLRTKPLDISAWAGKIVWEFHIYSYSVGWVTSNCDIFKTELGAAAGYLLTQGQAYTGPLWISEFGVGQQGGANSGLDDQDYAYLTCLASYLEGNDAEWSVWAIQGDYMERDGQVSYDETWGLLNEDWSDWRNPSFAGLLGSMWNITQGP